MRNLLKLVIICASFILCNSKPRQSADSVLRELQADKRSNEKVCTYVDNNYCNTWRSWGYCAPGNDYYDSMTVHCKTTCGFCGEKDCPDHTYCSYWRSLGYCQYGNYYYAYMKAYCSASCGICDCHPQPDSVSDCATWTAAGYCNPNSLYYDYMLLNCQTSCGFCVQPPTTTTKPPSTTPQPPTTASTTSGPSTSANMSTTAGPSTTSNPSTTAGPSTTSNPSSTAGPVTASNSSTTAGPSTTSNPSTTDRPSTTSNPSTTAGPSTTSNPSTTAGPSTTSNPSTTDGPSTTSNPSTTAGPSTTSNPSTTAGPSTTFNPSTTDVPSTTSNPSTTVPPTPTPAENACLKAHNDRRALHGASPLIWNATLVQHAQAWADQIAATGVIMHDPNRGSEGENIAWFKGHNASDCTDALTGWYDKEEPLYDYSNPGFTPGTAHFTQVVWKSTTAVGVAQASTGSGSSKQIYIVGRYFPAGNIVGFFQQNVGNKQSK